MVPSSLFMLASSVCKSLQCLSSTLTQGGERGHLFSLTCSLVLWRVKVKVKSLSCVRLFATPWTVAYQAPPSPGFSRQEYWSGVPFRDTANKYRWRVWGVLTVYGSHWVCPSSRQCVLPGSTVLRIQVALQGNCPTQALHFVHFPGLSCLGSGSRVLHKGTDSVGCAFCALPRSE